MGGGLSCKSIEIPERIGNLAAGIAPKALACCLHSIATAISHKLLCGRDPHGKAALDRHFFRVRSAMSKRERIGCFLRHTVRILVMVACLQGIVHEAKAQKTASPSPPATRGSGGRLNVCSRLGRGGRATPSPQFRRRRGQRLCVLMTGNTSYCQTAVNSLMNFTIAQS